MKAFRCKIELYDVDSAGMVFCRKSHEVEDKEIYSSIQESYFSGTTAFELDAKHMLRTQTSGTTLRDAQARNAEGSRL